MSAPACMCAKHETSSVGGFVLEDDHVVATHTLPIRVPDVALGSLMVGLGRHVARLDDLTARRRRGSAWP